MATGRARVESKFKQGTFNVTGQSPSKAGIVAITERGRVGEPVTVTSPESFRKEFGGITLTGTAAHLMDAFYAIAPGAQLNVTRTMHYTNIATPGSHIGVIGTRDLLNAGVTASGGTTTSTIAETYALLNGDDIDIDEDGAPAGTATVAAAAATDTDVVGYPIAPLVAQTMGVKINGGVEQTVTAAGGETTALNVAALLNGQLTGCSVGVLGGQVVITTDRQGTGASIEISTPGTLNAILLFPVGPVTGTGNVANVSLVTVAELKTMIELVFGNITVTSTGGLVTITRDTVGSGFSFQVQGGTLPAKLGLDLLLHAGIDATPAATLTVDGKTKGAYTAALTIQIAAASNGKAEFFNLIVLKDGVAQETWPNLTMDATAVRWAETIINATGTGSDLIAVTDLLLALTPTQKRPANGTSAALAGGDDGLAGLVDIDFIGDAAAKTGLYALDSVNQLRLFGVPYRSSGTMFAALVTYVASREKSLYGVASTPDVAAAPTVADMVTYGEANVLGVTEFVSKPCWPWPSIANPNQTIFPASGAYVDDEYPARLYVDPCLLKMARFIGNDQSHPDGVYTSAAGLDNDQGVLPMVTGLQFMTQVMDPGNRDLLADAGIEPIVKPEGRPYYFDDGDNPKIDGDWPRQWHTRAAIHLVESIKFAWEVFKHRKNTSVMRNQAGRAAERFIKADAPAEAWDVNEDGAIPQLPDGAPLWLVDVSDERNPREVRALKEFRAGIGLGFANDAKFIIIEVSRPALP